MRATILAACVAALLCAATGALAQSQSRPATAATIAAQREAAQALPPPDERDLEFARRGFIATWPERTIARGDGGVAYDLGGDDFIQGEAPDTVNPSLWRFGRVNATDGLFRLADGLYQVRNFDISSITFIETDTGYVVVDPLTYEEPARAAYELVKRHVGDRPIRAVIYTHSHSDHFAGIRGIVDPADVASGRVMVIAPQGFIEEVASEFLIAGPAMGRRAFYQFGMLLPRDPTAHVSAGMGVSMASGAQELVAPNRLITHTGETVTIDGLRIEFLMAPEAEAPSGLAFYLPKYRALCTGELATPTIHNVQTLRGARVRDAKLWADYIGEMVRLWGDGTDVVFASHLWPRFGHSEAVEFLENQRDMYKFIHDQTVRLMNSGLTPLEIADRVVLPQSLASQWYNRGYYGTVSHNVRAVYDRYMGWYDGVPAHLNPHPPEAVARRYVAAMGGARRLLREARRAFDAGDYRWSAELANHGVFANVQGAAEILANSYEQLGYQSESAIWRNIYLTGALELRQGVQRFGRAGTAENLSFAVTPVALFLDVLATRVAPERAEGRTLTVNLVLRDTGERRVLRLCNSVLVHEEGASDAAGATVVADKRGFLATAFGALPVDRAIEQGMLTIEGDRAVYEALLGVFERPDMNFNIVAP